MNFELFTKTYFYIHILAPNTIFPEKWRHRIF